MEQNKRKIRTGKVVSDSMDKTAIVVVEWSSKHRLYKKSEKKFGILSAILAGTMNFFLKLVRINL